MRGNIALELLATTPILHMSELMAPIKKLVCSERFLLTCFRCVFELILHKENQF